MSRPVWPSEQAELSVRQAELNYQNLQNSAKDAKLTANASGIIAKLYVDEGAMSPRGPR